jgi:peptide deformylase
VVNHAPALKPYGLKLPEPAATSRLMNATVGSFAAPTADAQQLPILVAPHPALRAKARRVRPEDMDLVRDLLPKLFASMYAAPGIGLAAPQVGVGLRLAVVDLQPEDKPAPIVLINPEIAALSEDQVVREEGCLSLPGQYADVSRPARVRVRFEDETGKGHEIEAEGLLAACLQHELDHLDGVLFVDHLTPLRRNMLMRKLAKEQKEKARAG